jgi:hypothetical protein
MALVLAGCGGSSNASDASVDARVDAPVDASVAPLPWMPLGDGTCGARARRVGTVAGVHVEPSAGPIAWLTNPPSSGNHFPTWARWGAWPDLPRGNWVHNLEHGGVALLYRCPSGTCADTRDALVQAAAGFPGDPACGPADASPARVRVVITNDRLIETPVAAAAWGAVYEASCVDAASLRLFYAMFAGHAPEDFCADGSVP